MKEKFITGKNHGKTFQLGEKIGSGNLGIVYKATGEDGKDYALKLPNRTDISQRGDPVESLRREAKIQERFKHPHIMPVVLFDETISEEKDPFLVTPLAASDLQKYIVERATIKPEKAGTVSKQVAQALEAIHDEQYVHGDVGAHNVLLSPNRGNIVAQLTDFGSTLPLDTYQSEPVFATELFAAPERFDGVCSPAVDQYAWAAGVVYPAFTGEAPSNPEEYDEILDIYGYRRSMETIIGSQNMTPLHEVFQEVATVALKEFPSERYGSMSELLSDLDMKLSKSQELQQKERKHII